MISGGVKSAKFGPLQARFLISLKIFKSNKKYYQPSKAGALAYHLQRLQNPKWPLGNPKKAYGEVSSPRLLGALVNFL